MRGMRQSQLLHVIVGAGNVAYFINCIRSISRFEEGEIFAVYNWIDHGDLLAIEAERHEIEGFVSRLLVQKNVQNTRTGSLYKANNLGLEYARQGFRYVNFVQADMQMMWWDHNILERAEAITNSHCARGFDTIFFFTQLPVRGKKSNVYDGWSWDDHACTFRTTGFADVCLIPLFDGLNREFSFLGDEASMSDAFSEQGSALFYHPHPFLAPIPFPDNVRDHKQRGTKVAGKTRSDILRINPQFLVDLNASSLHPLVMEDAVFPNGWACATPYWPSDTTSSTWLRRKYNILRADPLSLFEVRKATGRLSRCPFLRSSPGLVRTITSLMKLFKEETQKRFARGLRRSF